MHGVTGSNIGAFMIIPGTGYEGSSGGPFFRDINNQGATQQELYFCECWQRLFVQSGIRGFAVVYLVREGGDGWADEWCKK